MKRTAEVWKENLLCGLRNLGDQLIGGRVEHIHPPERAKALNFSHTDAPYVSPPKEDTLKTRQILETQIKPKVHKPIC